MLDAILLPAELHTEVPVLTWVFGTASLLSLGGGIALGVLSSDVDRDGATMREVFDFYDAREREAIAANVLYVAAGGFAVAALVPLIVALAEDTSDPAPTLTLVPSFGLDPSGPSVGLLAGGAF